ncbi:MAG: Endonuclease III, partial [uncultured Friedmanniella sp.]
GLPHPAGAARRHDPRRAEHRQAGQHRDSGAVRPLPRRRRLRRCGPRRAGSAHHADRLLPRQDRQPGQARRGADRALRRRGAGPARRPRHPARGGPQDRQRRPRQRLRRARHHRRHPRRPAVPPLRLDGADRPREGRARDRRAVPAQGLGAALPARHLARPPLLPRPQPGLRRLPRRPLVPLLRRGRDGPGQGGQAHPGTARM